MPQHRATPPPPPARSGSRAGADGASGAPADAASGDAASSAGDTTPAATQRRGRWLALDVGRVRIGVAIADPDTGYGHAAFVHARQGTRRDVDAIMARVGADAIDAAIVGLPPASDDPAQCSAKMAREFARRFVAQTGIPAFLVDESDSTVQASERLERLGLRGPKLRAKVDAEAAAIILGRYADGWDAEPVATADAAANERGR